MKFVPLFEGADNPNFNYAAALDAYNWAIENQAEATIVAKMLGFEDFVNKIDNNREMIQEAIDYAIIEKAINLKDSLKRSAISKAAEGEEIDHIIEAGDILYKAFGDPIDAEERMRRRRQATQQLRGPGGQFKTYKARIFPITSGNAASKQPLPESTMSALGAPSTADLSPTEKAKAHNAFLQVKEMLSEFSNLNDDDVAVAYNYKDELGKETTHIKTGTSPTIHPDEFKQAYTDLDSIEVTVSPSLNAYGGAFDLLGNVTGRRMANNMIGVGQKFTPAMEGYSSALQAKPGEEIGTGQEVYDKVGAAAQLIDATIGNHIGPAGKVATALGGWVGSHGAEAEKILGPGARKASYRYRGVEKRPDAILQRNIDNALKQIAAQYTKEGIKAEQARDLAREFLIYGSESNFAIKSPKGITRKERVESPVIMHMSKTLPDMELANLQLASGHIPPSHGIIIDRNGAVVSQAVGYGDDWYLPFNLGTIGMVNGGEYIRTRTLGGPTSEDIYTSLITEARAFTVVSHSGVYNVEYDKTFRGTRRFNDKAKRMVDRYEKLLDAVKEGQVAPRIPAERYAELRADAMEDYPDDQKRFRDRLTQLENNEKRSPRMSQQDMSKARDGWISSTYAPTRRTADGREMDYQELKSEYAASIAESPVDGKTKATVYEEAAQRFDDNPIAVLSEKDPSIIDKWGRAKRNIEFQYARDKSAINLDSEGYYKALKALQEQFPYYIKSVKFRPLTGQELYVGAPDTGYVMPRFNRPAAAQAGYYAKDVLNNGGKVDANKTQYQNFRYRSSVDTASKPNTTETNGPLKSADSTTEEKSTAEKIQAGAKQSKKINSRWALYEQLTAPNTHAFWSDAEGHGDREYFPDFTENQWHINTGKRFSYLFGAIPGREKLDANNGVVRTGPLTKDEFVELMGDPKKAAEFEAQARLASTTFKVPGDKSVSSVDMNLLNAAGTESESDNKEMWKNDVELPDSAHAPRGYNKEFTFEGMEYKADNKPRVYVKAATQIISSLDRMSEVTGSSVNSIKLGDNSETMFNNSEFASVLKKDIVSNTDRLQKLVNSEDKLTQQIAIVEKLHRLRRLHNLYLRNSKLEEEKAAEKVETPSANVEPSENPTGFAPTGRRGLSLVGGTETDQYAGGQFSG